MGQWRLMLAAVLSGAAWAGDVFFDAQLPGLLAAAVMFVAAEVADPHK